MKIEFDTIAIQEYISKNNINTKELFGEFKSEYIENIIRNRNVSFKIFFNFLEKTGIDINKFIKYQ